MNLENKIESILFWKAEPLKISEIAKTLNVNENAVLESSTILASSLETRGIRLRIQDGELSLITAPENGQIIEKLLKEELNKELSKAAVETLSIILYRGPIKRGEIDYIRGVNSQFIVRNLMIRGLVDKELNKEDERGYLYKASAELLNFMGISSPADLPEYQKIKSEIEEFITASQNQDKNLTESVSSNSDVKSQSDKTIE